MRASGDHCPEKVLSESIVRRRFLSTVALTHSTFAFLIFIELNTYLKIPDIKLQNQKTKITNNRLLKSPQEVSCPRNTEPGLRDVS